jgi:hypothetical protein
VARARHAGRLAGLADVVVKPTVSAGSQDTARYGPDEPDKARAHADRLLAAGRPVMVQPYLAGVDTAGESMLVHSRRRLQPRLPQGGDPAAGESAETDALFRPEEVAVRQPTPAERRSPRRRWPPCRAGRPGCSTPGSTCCRTRPATRW